ncbi:hypothetical protein N7475_003735 [Penicillium sp. IBT 31633x]|nr:hypothetical protein N7475_003735 [Penicillium sp. IBT 31633x]
MNPEPPSLGFLPVEILCSIFRLLDPIALISISQTNFKFRAVVQPKRVHLLERLLELECIEEVGGVTPIFRSKDNHIDPDFTAKEWHSMRWACSLCLRMLPHEAFNNHSLLRLQYRKPLPGSPAAQSYTSWEPTSDGKSRKPFQIHKQLNVSKDEDQRIRRRYDLASKCNTVRRNRPRDMHARLASFQDSGMITFQGFSLDEYLCITQEEEQLLLDHEARLIERERCGFKRHLRKCNECRFQRGEISGAVDRSREDLQLGTAKVPILPSRHLPFASALDRSFPGISAIMKSVRPTNDAPVQRIYRANAFDSLWSMYMVRCPGCSRWQESRAFRLGATFPHWTPTFNYVADTQQNWDGTEITPDFIDGLTCNHCFVKENGREKLREDLLNWLDNCLHRERANLGYLLLGGWERLSRRVGHNDQLKRNSKINELVSSVQPVVDRIQNAHYLDTSLTDIAMLRLRFHDWVVVKENLGFEDQNALKYNAWDVLWHKNYDVIEAHLIWILSCQREMMEKDKSEALVDWALSRDGNTLK